MTQTIVHFSHWPFFLLLVSCILLGYLFSSSSILLDSDKTFLSPRKCTIILVTIILFGAALRFYGLDFGFPRYYHPDERKKVYVISKMLRRDTLDPDYFFHPTLLLYLTIIVSKLSNFFGFDITSIDTEYFVANDYLRRSLRILFAGRLVSALAGTLSIPMLYFISRDLFGRFTALLSALILVISPLHITCSRYLKEDCLLTFVMLIVIYFCSRVIKRGEIRSIYLASFFVGISIAVKYPGIICLSVVCLLPWAKIQIQSLRDLLNPDRAIFSHVIRSLLLVPCGFFICSPYSFLNLTQSTGGILTEYNHAVTGHHGLVISPISEWCLFYFSRTLIPGMSILTIAVSLMSIGVFFRRPTNGLFLIITAVSVFYFAAELIPSKPLPQPDRYILPCVPLVAILAAYFTCRLKNLMVTVILICCLVFYPLNRSIALASEIRIDTRKQATEWIVKNLPHSSRILTFGGSEYLCRIPRSFKAVAARLVIGTEKKNIAKRLSSSGYDYLVRAHFYQSRFEFFPHPAQERKAALEEIERSFTLVKKFTAPHGSYGFHNPTIEIYSLKNDEVRVKPE